MTQAITLTKLVNATPKRTYLAFLDPTDIKEWYRASDDWTTPWAKVDPVPGGKLIIRFQDPFGKDSFDYVGVFNQLIEGKLIDYDLEDGRNVRIVFEPADDGTMITETFDPENAMNPNLQRQGWINILDNLGEYLNHL